MPLRTSWISAPALYALLSQKRDNVVATCKRFKHFERHTVLECVEENLKTERVPSALFARVNDEAVARRETAVGVRSYEGIDWVIGQTAVIEVKAPLQESLYARIVKLESENSISLRGHTDKAVGNVTSVVRTAVIYPVFFRINGYPC